jgi:hypothetical protein
MGTQTRYTDKNETLRNEMWEAINIDAGMIAVPEDFVADKNLPRSQRLVWDESKSVYLLNGHHTLHCVVRFPTAERKRHETFPDNTNREQCTFR